MSSSTHPTQSPEPSIGDGNVRPQNAAGRLVKKGWRQATENQELRSSLLREIEKTNVQWLAEKLARRGASEPLDPEVGFPALAAAVSLDESDASLACVELLLNACDERSMSGVLAMAQNGQASAHISILGLAAQSLNHGALKLFVSSAERWALFSADKETVLGAVLGSKETEHTKYMNCVAAAILAPFCDPTEEQWSDIAYCALRANDNDLLQMACARSAKDALRNYRTKGNCPDEQGLPLLHVAITRENARAVEILLSAGCDPRFRDANGRPALIYAARESVSDEVLQMLLPESDIDEKDSEGKTALIWAAHYGRPEIVKTLVAAGVRPNIQDNKKNTALMYAMMGHAVGDSAFEIVDAVARASDLSIRCENGQTVLEWSSKNLTGEKGWKTLDALVATMNPADADAAMTQIMRDKMPKSAPLVAAHREGEALKMAISMPPKKEGETKTPEALPQARRI